MCLMPRFLQLNTHPFGLDVPPGLAAASLIVVDEVERRGEAIHLRKEIVVVKIGSTM